MGIAESLQGVSNELRVIAAEIARADINGFGNAVTAQADRINEILWSLQEERGVNHDN